VQSSSALFSFQHSSGCVGRFRVWPHQRGSKMIALRVGLLRHALRLRGASFPRARPTSPNPVACSDHAPPRDNPHAPPRDNPLGLKPQPLKFDTCHLLRALACDSASAKVQQWTRSGSGFCVPCLFLYHTRKSTNTDNLVKFQYVEQQIQSLRTPGIRCTLGTA
jgi:hypothetical protein